MSSRSELRKKETTLGRPGRSSGGGHSTCKGSEVAKEGTPMCSCEATRNGGSPTSFLGRRRTVVGSRGWLYLGFEKRVPSPRREGMGDTAGGPGEAA